MIGLRAPREVQATVYGFSASAIAIGFGLGPLVSGAVAATVSVSAGLFVAAGVAAILSLFLATLVREPRAPTP
jgi:MFS family permease